MATTGLSVIMLTSFIRILIPGFDLPFNDTVLLIFSANVVIHLGLLVIHKFESKYLAVEVLLDIAYTTAVLVVFGLLFDWFGVTPIWILVVMAATIHIISLFLYVTRYRQEANDINKLLKKRNKNKRMSKNKLLLNMEGERLI